MSNFKTEPPEPLCRHNLPLKRSRKYRATCAVCGSFWDLEALRSAVAYDRTYPEMRSHFNPSTGRTKVKTLQEWIQKTAIDLNRLVVCEIGFGGGFCLRYLQDHAHHAFGIEAVPANIEHAVGLGVRKDDLFLADQVPALLPRSIDLWIFQDSFEHLPDPTGFVEWLLHNSSSRAKILLVAPDATTLSARVLGRWWPHRVADHRFHWSRDGLVAFFSKRGFILERSFRPQKHVTLGSILAHAQLKLFRGRLQSPPGTGLHNIVLRLNFGEMGLFFGRVGENEF